MNNRIGGREIVKREKVNTFLFWKKAFMNPENAVRSKAKEKIPTVRSISGDKWTANSPSHNRFRPSRLRAQG